MSDNSKIEWTDASWPVTVGCDHVSPGCDNCYAAVLTSGRLAHLPEYAGLAEKGKFNGTVRCLPERMDWPSKWRKPKRIFVCSMSDLFHASVPDEFIAKVFAAMASTPRHTFQVLTKRHARLRSLVGSDEFRKSVQRRINYAPPDDDYVTRHWKTWPLPNVWLGVSVEDQQWADIRVPALVQTPAAVRFLSCEPLLGPVDLTRWMPAGIAKWHCGSCDTYYSGGWQETGPSCGRVGYWCGSHTGNGRPNDQPISWVIAGGESGGNSRPMHPQWARSLRDQCVDAGVPFLFKQWGNWQPYTGYEERRHLVQLWEWPQGTKYGPGQVGGVIAHMNRVGKKAAGRMLDGRTWDEFPRSLEQVAP